MNKKFKIATLGCRTNQYESQAYRNQLLQMGFIEAQSDEQADVCIVNTCTVTESADSSSRHQIREFARKNENAKLVVTGCLAERKPEMIQQIAGVSLVVPNSQKEELVRQLYPDEDIPEFSIQNFESHTRAFVKVQDGCNSFCTYCIIPYVRGRSRSRTIAEIVDEVTQLVANGYKEVVITGINVGDFDGGKKDGTPDCLADLVRAIDVIEGLERIRISSIDPDEVDENLANAVLHGKKTCHSMHVVLQSGSNVILKKMNRKYTRQVFLQTVDYLLQKDADFTFTTDVIVGFPGETEEDFENTLELMRKVKFAKVHMFPYSERERTKAATYINKVPPEVIKLRKQKVLELSEQIAFNLREQFVGRTMTVLTENIETESNEIVGHTSNFLPVRIANQHLTPNQIVNVTFFENSPTGLKGELV